MIPCRVRRTFRLAESSRAALAKRAAGWGSRNISIRNWFRWFRNERSIMAGALDGIKVVEVANYLTGPFAAMLLADMGAQVIKVEPRDGGDPFRGWDEHGYSSHFRCVNRNKRSITLDLQTDTGGEILLRLAYQCDVLIENHRPGVMKRWGADYKPVAARNPRIIYCSISGFG